MILEIQHETRLEYTTPISEWLGELRMEPVTDNRQSCHFFHVGVSQPAPVFNYLDGFGNRVHHFNLLNPFQQVRVLAASIVETEPRYSDPMNSRATFPLAFDDIPYDLLDYMTLRGPTRTSELLQPLLEETRPRNGSRLGMWLCQVGEIIRERFEYAKYVTDAQSPIDDLLKYRKGVCQDFAHLLLSLVRSHGVPARYVSGYIHRPNKESQSHAWCEMWLPDVGWTGLDPTNGCPITEEFVKVAVGRDFTDVPPNKGTYRGQGTETITVRVATRSLDRLPSLSWQEQLPPLDVPATLVARQRPIMQADEQLQQQQQQQQ